MKHSDEIHRAGPAGPTVLIMTEPSGMSGYATPSYPGGAGLTEPPARPSTVTLAFWAWLVMTALSLVSLIIVLTSPIWDQAVAAGLRAADVNGVDINASTVVNAAKITSVVGFLIGAALYLLFAFKMRAGRNWARVVLTVVGVLGVLGAVLPTYRSVTVNGNTFVVQTYGVHWISLAVLVAALVLMFMPASNAYFTASKAYRQAHR